MAKKTKRKVSSGKGNRQAQSTGTMVAEEASAPAMVATPAAPAAPYTPASGTSTSRPARRGSAAVEEFKPDYAYIVKDLKRVGMLAGSFFVILIALSFIIK